MYMCFKQDIREALTGALAQRLADSLLRFQKAPTWWSAGVS